MDHQTELKIVKLYVDDEHSVGEIADMYNTYPNKILRILKKHGTTLRTKSEAQKLALKKGKSEHPTKGKKRSHAERVKISESMVGYWSEVSDEQREKLVEASRQRWEAMTPQQQEEMRSRAAQAVRAAAVEGSKFEKFVVNGLVKAGYDVRYHYTTLLENQNLEIDIYLPDLKTVVEIDGPSHFLPIWGEDKLKKQIKSDTEKNGLLLSKGMIIIRVKQLDKTPSLFVQQSIVEQIIEHLKEFENKRPPEGKRFIEIEV